MACMPHAATVGSRETTDETTDATALSSAICPGRSGSQCVSHWVSHHASPARPFYLFGMVRRGTRAHRLHMSTTLCEGAD